jgi:lantibiotic modifying enzyme
VTSQEAKSYRELAEAGWRWVLDQVRWDDDGPWIPEAVTAEVVRPVPDYRDGMHSGVGGLAHALAEIRQARTWSDEEQKLADAIAVRVRDRIATETATDYFDGLVSSIGVLIALEADGTADAVDRLLALATPDGWPQETLGPPRFLPEARINDLTLGTAGVLLGGVWALRQGVPAGRELAEHAATVLLAEAEEEPTGTNWRYVPLRFRTDPARDMPNLSHGVAGIATALALAGAELDRPDLVAAARSGAEHLVTLGDASGQGFVVPRYVPELPDEPGHLSFGWCHGAAGTSLLFAALDEAGVEEIAGEEPASWRRRCLHSVRTSGIPDRLSPGFWDNDGRCCGTAGAGDVLLDAWEQSGHDEDLAFARHLADALVERAIRSGPHACWRFVEHKNPEPLLPPGVGWMQGAAGIAAYLFRTARVHQLPIGSPA